MDPETGKYLLNGNFIVTLSQKGLIYEGVSMDYSGAVEVVERLNCTRMLNRELIVQVLPLHPRPRAILDQDAVILTVYSPGPRGRSA